MSSSLEFNEFIPRDLYAKYFDIMAKDGMVYICIIQNDSQVGSVYIENPNRSLKGVEGIVRVFFDIPDLRQYGKQVANAEGLSFDMVRRWEMSFTALLDYVAKLDARQKELGNKGIRAVASSIHNESFVDIDVLWTAEQDLMV